MSLNINIKKYFQEFIMHIFEFCGPTDYLNFGK